MRSHTILAILVLVGLTSAASIAQTWDATRDFGASNPNGAWSYGWGVTGTSFTLYPIYYSYCDNVCGQPGVCWTADIGSDHTPLVAFNTTGVWQSCTTVVKPPDVLLLHPAPDWEPGDSIVKWTAPVTATYRISGFFEICDINPSGIIGLVFRNGTLVFRGELLGPPAQQSPEKCGGRENFYFPDVALNAGDVISFGLNSDGTYHFDSTGFNATIVTPPNAPPCANCSQH